MKKHNCKLCFRKFANGRALGGHMRSHMKNLPLPPKQLVRPPPTERSDKGVPASSSSSKRSIRSVDPEMGYDIDAGSVVLQDRESEIETSKYTTRRRSRRINITNSVNSEEDHRDAMKKTRTLINPTSKAESFAEPELPSSVSDYTVENVALCLMMLSRDKWKRQRDEVEQDHDNVDHDYDHHEEEEVEEDDDWEEQKPKKNRIRGKYKCETCNKVFGSYQALGGHRGSHKNSSTRLVNKQELEKDNDGNSVSMAEKKTRECPVCLKFFSSGQALGGHKRIHVTCTSPTSEPIRSSTTFGDSLIDLNLPAQLEDDEVSQIGLSAVSDAEFANPISE